MSSSEVYGAFRTPIPAPPEFDDEVRFVGSCCACRREDVRLRNVVCMTFRAPSGALGKGWGCVVCAIPADGAIAVVCDECMAAERPIVDVCAGYARDPERTPAEPLRPIPWSHIRAFHRTPLDVLLAQPPDIDEDPDGAEAADQARRISAEDLGWEMDGEEPDDVT